MTRKLWQLISAVALSVLVFFSAWSSANPLLKTTHYDKEIYEAWEEYIPQTKCWLWWKAQLYQESLLNPNAKSPVGAMGLAQFMPGSWQHVIKKLRWDHSVSPYDPERSIEAGAFYMKYLHGQWRSKRTEIDRLRLAQASYNAGLKHLLTAQRKANMATDWESISGKLHLVTGRHSRETLTYVVRIQRWKDTLEKHQGCMQPY